MSKYIQKITKITVLPENDPIFSELATTIEIDDEAAGEYVRVVQYHRHDDGTVCFDREEWPVIRDAIDKLIAECRDRD